MLKIKVVFLKVLRVLYLDGDMMMGIRNCLILSDLGYPHDRKPPNGDTVDAQNPAPGGRWYVYPITLP